MRYDCAPMEGVTGYVFRNAHHRCFAPADRYFMPFVSPDQAHCFSPRQMRELDPKHNEGVPVVPQLLGKNAADFLWAAGELRAMGYREVNLNLGCPSGTVVAKGKGAGFLAHPEELDRFLDTIFTGTDMKISVKTRLGLHESEEFGRILEIYNRYPISELIIHPRVRKDFYRNPARVEEFARFAPLSRAPVSYNGDLVNRRDCREIATRFPQVETLMLGRGLVANPALIGQLRGGEKAGKESLREFHDEIFEGYRRDFQSDRNAIARMKEFWFYCIRLFRDHELYQKKLQKAVTAADYRAAVDAVFRDLEILEDVEGPIQ